LLIACYARRGATAMSSDWIKTTCPYCGVGCGVEAKWKPNSGTEIRGDKEHPANKGLLCSKGSALADTLTEPGYLRHALIKGQHEKLERALDYVASRFNQIIAEHGPDAVAIYASGQLLTEDYYLANKLMKGFIGSANIDTNSRLCMSSTVVGHKRAFGNDTVPGCYEDLELADLVILTGSNLAWCHPILFARLRQAKTNNPNMRIVVIDPRRTDSCDIADLHLPLKPGSDVALFNGLARYLIDHQHIDTQYVKNHCDGSLELIDHLNNPAYDITATAQACDLPQEQLETLYQWFAQTPKTVTAFSQGVNQSSRGSDKVNALINCHLLTGRVGLPGASPLSITGQPNAMGGREVGGLANTLAAHLEFTPDACEAVQTFWQSPGVAKQPGLKAVEMFEAVASGQIKAIWIMGTNPAVSLPNSNSVRDALLACPLVVVSECIKATDTARYADVLLPAAGWSEKSGTVTNTERRISRQRAFRPQIGETKPDWWLIAEVAKRMGFAQAFSYNDESEIFAEHVAMTQIAPQLVRDLDLGGWSGLDRAAYDALQPTQWPITAQGGTTRLMSDGRFFTPSGRAQLLAVDAEPPATQTHADFPLALNTGRIRDQWHTMTRTGRAARLSGLQPEPLLSMHPHDLEDHHLQAGDIVQITSRVGQTLVRVTPDEGQRPGEVFMPIHWTTQNSSHGVVSQTVTPEFDAFSGQPESKFTPVNVDPWAGQSEAWIYVREPIETQAFDYWVSQTLEHGLLYRVASTLAPQELREQIKACRKGQVGDTLSFEDPITSRFRMAQRQQGELHFAAAIGPFGQAQYNWLAGFSGTQWNDNLRRAVLRGTSPEPDLGPVICGCHQVRQQTLIDHIRAGEADSVASLGERCQAGTNCGSCVPSLKRLLSMTEPVIPTPSIE
jgi:assimilatory nitrate reductase catalytic subunit